MNLTNLFKIAFKALSNNKLRGFLTMLGIIIGVGSVITMLAIGQGSKRSIQAQISEMGSNMIMIHPGGDRRGGVRLDAADMESLKLKDLEDIQAQARYISYISPSVNSSGQAIFGANNTPTTVYGISPEYLDIRRYKVEDGDMFTEQDIQTAATVTTAQTPAKTSAYMRSCRNDVSMFVKHLNSIITSYFIFGK